MSLVLSVVRRYLRTRLRGQTRVTLALAHRDPRLQVVPVEVAGMPPTYVDLRDPSNHGYFAGSPHDRVPWHGAIFDVLRKITRPGDVAYDVGANRGFLTAGLSSLVGPGGHVYAFEINPELHPPLRRTIAGLGNATLCDYGLADRAGRLMLRVPENREMSSIVAEFGESHAVHSLECRIETLDEQIAAGALRRPAVVKMDIEGAELLAFRGARKLLDAPDAPILLFESNLNAARSLGEPLDAAAVLLRGLDSPGYALFVVHDWGLVTRMVPGQLVHDNVLAIPASRASRWPELQGAQFLNLS